MVVCRFWEKGNCRNGNSCKFEHPAARGNHGGGGGGNPFGGGSGGQSRNPFDSLRDDQPRGPRGGDSYRPEPRRFDNDRSRGQGFGGATQASGTERNFRLDADTIKADITAELPEWPMSCYSGHPADVPKHFFPPEMELSPEEVRTEYYLLRLQGQETQAQQKEANAAAAAQQAVADVVRDIHGAIRRVAAAKREHPNRWDIVDQNRDLGNPNPFRPTAAPAVATSIPAQPTGFGQPSGAGLGANPFGQSSNAAQSSGFGQPSQPSHPSSGLGQPSQLGNPSSGFGQPSQLGDPPSGFGQPSQLGQNSSFGRPSTAGGFGQPTQPGGPAPFGQAPQTQGGSGFGQPSALGAKPAFGQPSAAGQVSAFGQPSAVGSTGGLGKPSPLGQPAPFGQKPNPFGQPAPSGQSPFGQVSQQPTSTSPFGQPSSQTPQANPFGQQSQAFGQQGGQSSSGFGQPTQPQQQASGFGQPGGGFGQPSGGFGNPSQQPNNAFATHQNAARPSTENSQTSLQLNTSTPAMNGTYTKNPPSATPRDSDPPDEMFGGRKGEFEEAYKHVLSTGMFANNIMPEVAPLHSWVGWGPMERRFT